MVQYPSILLRELADRIDPLEDRILEWLDGRDLRFWEWPRLRLELRLAQSQRDEAVRQNAQALVRLREDGIAPGPYFPRHPSGFVTFGHTWLQKVVAREMRRQEKG